MNNNEITENKEVSEINNKNQQEQETPTIININNKTNNIGETGNTEITREITVEIERITTKEKVSTMPEKAVQYEELIEIENDLFGAKKTSA